MLCIQCLSYLSIPFYISQHTYIYSSLASQITVLIGLHCSPILLFFPRRQSSTICLIHIKREKLQHECSILNVNAIFLHFKMPNKEIILIKENRLKENALISFQCLHGSFVYERHKMGEPSKPTDVFLVNH